MRGAIRAYGRSRKEKKTIMSKKKILIPVAACLTLLIAATAIFAAGGFGSKKYFVTLGSGDTVTYKKTGASTAASLNFGYDYAVETRELTAEELQAVSPLLTFGFGTFRTDTGALVRFEGAAGDTKIIMAVPGVCLTDAVIDSNPAVCEVKGVPVQTAYFKTAKNSKGITTSVFCGEFQLNGIRIHAELATRQYDNLNGGWYEIGDEDSVCAALSQQIYQFIENGEPAFSAVTLRR